MRPVAEWLIRKWRPPNWETLKTPAEVFFFEMGADAMLEALRKQPTIPMFDEKENR